MSLFDVRKRNRLTKRAEYIVFPPENSEVKFNNPWQASKSFKFKDKAERQAISWGPGSIIRKSMDYISGSTSSVKDWIVDYDLTHWNRTKKNKLKLYTYYVGRGRSRTFSRNREDKLWRQFSYKVYSKMISFPNVNIENLINLFIKQGIDFKNPSEDMIEYSNSCLSEYKTLDDIPWSYWSDRCSHSRAYVIYRLYNLSKNND